MRARRGLHAAAAALLFASLGAAMTFAQVRPPGGSPKPQLPLPRPIRTPLPVPGFTATPLPSNTPAPGLPFPSTSGVGGQRVPLASLAPLPPQTPGNTANFRGGRHRFAATGADINYFTDINNSNCASAVGTLIPLGCDIQWQSTGLSGAHRWQDYYVAAGSTTATAIGGTYTGTGGFQHTSANLTPTGTYVFGTYDTTAAKWVSVIYVSVGNVNVFGTYADSAATVPQQQFTAANGVNVYANATGLTQGQSYVVYIESTSVNPTCTYVAPPGTVTSNTLCDPTTSSGIVAVVGAQNSAAITAVWPLSSTTPTGTYAVVLYNLTTKTRLAMRQVSITKSGASGAIALTPTSGNAALGTNWPTPPPSPYSTATAFAFDSTSESSDTGWTMKATGLAASKNYTFTVTDPTGMVVSGPTTVASNSSGVVNRTYTFGNTQSPSNYVGNTYTVQMYNQSTGAVDASQAFQILGYNVLTQFKDPNAGTLSTALVLPQGASQISDLQFTNDGDTYYGSGNGDTIDGIAFNTGASGLSFALTDPSVTSCGATCQQETVADTKGQNWTVQVNCYGGGSNAGCTLTAYPATTTQSLAMNASLDIPNVQFNNVPGKSGCTSGCSATTSLLPNDGVSWSVAGSSSASNAVYFTNGGGKTWAGTASLSHVGYRDSGNVFTANKETHGYANNATNAIYTSSSPYTTPNGYADVWAITITNNASLGTANLTQFEVVMPTPYTPSGTITNVSVDGNSPTQWSVVIPCPVTGAPASSFCLKAAGGNGGIAPGASQTVYIDLTPPPPSAFSYSDWTFQAITPTQFTMTPDGSFTGFVPQNTYDSTASAGYSLNGNLITPSFAPTSEGQNTNNTVAINVTDASTAQDPFPDYLDMIAIDIPSANTFANLAGMPTGWSLLGTSTPSAGVTRYWFGLCAGQFVTADGPVTNPPPVNPTVPSCGTATEANAIAPGQTFTVSGNLQTGTSNITATMYAHGANVGGWSAAHTFQLNVTAVSATAGFSAAGGYPSATAVNSPNTPQIGADSDTTYGNSFTYVIKNTSGTGQNLTSAKITIPGLDVSAVLPADGTAWTLTSTPAISGTAYGCSVTGSASANRTGTNNGYGAYNGGITIGGGSCSIPPNSALTITFTAKAPFTVNDSYQFSTVVNGAVTAAEQWQTDTFVQIILAASLQISVNPGNPGPGGSNPVVNCPTCMFNTASNIVDFGAVANTQTVAGSDVVRVSVYTNAGSTTGWKLYASTNVNPANTGNPTNELLTSIDSTHSAPSSGVNYDQTSYAVIPTTSPGLLLMDTGSGHAAQRTPFDEIMNFEISIQGGPTTPNTATVTYTFISN